MAEEIAHAQQHKTRVIIACPFALAFQSRNNKTRRVWADPVWIAQRVALFKQTTLRSLQQQQFQAFDIVLRCSADAYAAAAPHIEDLRSHGVQMVFDEGRAYIAALPADVTDLFYIRIDADDMYAPPAVLHMHMALRSCSAVQCIRGFWWDIRRCIVRRWVAASPPFYGLRRARADTVTFGNFYAYGRGHAKFRQRYRPAVLTQDLFLVIKHAQNHRGAQPPKKRLLLPEQVLPKFGIMRDEWTNGPALLKRIHDATYRNSDA